MNDSFAAATAAKLPCPHTSCTTRAPTPRRDAMRTSALMCSALLLALLLAGGAPADAGKKKAAPRAAAVEEPAAEAGAFEPDNAEPAEAKSVGEVMGSMSTQVRDSLRVPLPLPRHRRRRHHGGTLAAEPDRRVCLIKHSTHVHTVVASVIPLHALNSRTANADAITRPPPCTL